MNPRLRPLAGPRLAAPCPCRTTGLRARLQYLQCSTGILRGARAALARPEALCHPDGRPAMSHSATHESAILARQSPGTVRGGPAGGGAAISLVLTYLVVPLERSPAAPAGRRFSQAHRSSRSSRRAPTCAAPRAGNGAATAACVPPARLGHGGPAPLRPLHSPHVDASGCTEHTSPAALAGNSCCTSGTKLQAAWPDVCLQTTRAGPMQGFPARCRPTGARGRHPSMEDTGITYKTCACSLHSYTIAD